MTLGRFFSAVVVGSCFAAPSFAQSACKDTAGFVRTVGSDTVDVESVTFRRDSLTGMQSSRGGVIGYRAWFDSALVVNDAFMAIWKAGEPVGGPATQEGAFRRVGDTAFFGVRAADRPTQLQQTVNRGIAFMLTAMSGLEELLTRRLIRSGRTEMTIPIFYPARTSYPVATIRRVGPDSVVVAYQPGAIVEMKIDSAGRILGSRYREPEPNGSHMMVERIPCDSAMDIIRRRGNPP